MKTGLRLSGGQYEELRAHLFPGDGKEAVALLLCGRLTAETTRILTAYRVIQVPHEACTERSEHMVTWPTSVLLDHHEAVWKLHLSIVKVHSHPTGFDQFSSVDDRSDAELALSWECMTEDDRHHGSCVMLPDGSMFGRSLINGAIGPMFDFVQVSGHDIKRWSLGLPSNHSAAQERNIQTFGEGTTSRLRDMSVGVVGCSGTGSVVIEQLARLGVGRFVLVDPDKVEEKNLNRILNATVDDARNRLPKVAVMARLIHSLEQGQGVVTLQANLDSTEAVQAIATCDVAFGCVDTVEGRSLLNRLAAYYHVPYIDIGVQLEADGKGGISRVCGGIQYYASGMPSLSERQAFDPSQLKAEDLRRTNPAEYQKQKQEKYIKGVEVDRPAVLPVNMFFASLAVNDFLARIHPIRNMANVDVMEISGNLCEVSISKHQHHGEPSYLTAKLGIGDRVPLLDRPSLSP